MNGPASLPRFVLALGVASLLAACPGRGSTPSGTATVPSPPPAATSSPSTRSEPPERTPPRLRRDISTDTYVVRGATPAQIVASIRRRGPGKFWAQTQWSIGWNYDTAEVGSSCRTDAVVVTLNLRFLFPRWKAPTGTSPATRAWWRRTLAELHGHEGGHRAIAERASRNVLNALDRLGGFSDCGRLRHIADAHARAAYRRGVAHQRIYDRATDHGRSQ